MVCLDDDGRFPRLVQSIVNGGIGTLLSRSIIRKVIGGCWIDYLATTPQLGTLALGTALEA